MITSKICRQCGKKAILSREFNIGTMLFQDFSCGHTQVCKKLEPADFADFQSTDGHKPYNFQLTGASWAINSNGRFLIADEPGLGKTIQFLMVANSLHNTKFLVLCKSSLKVQWAKEAYRWCNEALVQLVEAENEFLLPGCKGYIVSYDLLWRFKDIPAFIKRLGVNLIGLDEVQHLKNSDSKRTNCVRVAVKQVDYVGALSGTPIEKNAGEYFPILNMLHPEKFPTLHGFEKVWVETYWDGRSLKKAGLKDYKAFQNYTKDFIIRRKRIDVLPDLPKVNRDFRFSELGLQVEAAYKETLKQFQQYYLYGGLQDSGLQRQANILSYLSKMRHLTGLAKVDPVIDFVSDFIEETDRKIVIFVHHKDVAFATLSRLQNLKAQANGSFSYGKDILSLTSDLTPDQRNSVVENFWKDDYRVLVASTLASGEGLNLQCCADMVLAERQWNPSKEEQVEGRFTRIGRPQSLIDMMGDKVNAMYPVAVGTVDEFFAANVEKKRAHCANTLDGLDMKWDESSIMQELAETLAISGGRKWGF